MSVLNRKLGRDIRGSAGALAAVVAIIAVGTGLLVGFGSAQRVLKASQTAYYSDYRFADFWVDVKKAPRSAVARIAELPGVAAVRSRVVFDVILDLAGVIQPISGRLISVPGRGWDKIINGVCLVRGSGFSDERDQEVVLSEDFARAHRLGPGDRIGLILNRKRESFVIVGTAISPEYVYMVRGEGDFTPDAEHFGVLYVKEDYAREVLDFKDSCNQIVGRLVPGDRHDVDLLLERIDRMLDPYGVLATTPRSRQASHRFLSDEIHGLGISAVLMPSVFLLVAALVLNIVMSRAAERQRVVIGTLKALGYSDRSVLTHLLGFGLVVGVLGGLAGGGLGVALVVALVEMYKGFFQFPAFAYQVHPDLLLLAMAVSVAFALTGTAKGVWRVLRLQPAEAMRPKPPERGGAVFLERLPALWKRLGFRTHIALRSLARNRVRTLTGVVCSALATSIILTTLIMYDSMWFLVDFQFEHVAHSDADIGMRDEKSMAALLEGQSLPGVDYAEPVLALTCDLRKGRVFRRLTLTGLPQRHRLTTPMDMDMRPIAIPPDGLVLSRKLAELLTVGVGDYVELTPVRGRRRTVRAPVLSIVEGFLGLECYADLEYLSRLVGEASAVSAVQVSLDRVRADDFYRAIKQLPNAQGLNVPANTKANIESTFVETMAFSLTLMVVFAGVIAFGTVLNASLIEISERTRDIAGFRVLGYRPGKVAGIFFRQNVAIFAVGLVLALPLGYAMTVVFAKAYDTELFRMPVIVKPQTVVVAALTSFAFVLMAQWFIYRQIVKLDWVEGIKVKE